MSIQTIKEEIERNPTAYDQGFKDAVNSLSDGLKFDDQEEARRFLLDVLPRNDWKGINGIIRNMKRLKYIEAQNEQ